ncbi:SRPBCC family protein [uncultured Chitinophaga sp.]|jgi:Predicted integral membrane protein|uniref:SRPBCC family protein n=1 Tax=uncultured Chitinophaga sp. TaxID=339340 RepID=UPI002622BE1F|nr:SRPBCC family protein [uncultured Chitinophaga sp.]
MDAAQTPGKSSIRINIRKTERMLSAAGGAFLLTSGVLNMRKHPVMALLKTIAGGYLLYRGATGHCPLRELITKALEQQQSQPLLIREALTVNRPRNEVYRYWRQLDNLPLFMKHLVEVNVENEQHSQWKMRLPGDLGTVDWKAEIVEDRPDELLVWRSLEGSDIDTAGEVIFNDAPGNRGTEVHVTMFYHAPAGALGKMAAQIFHKGFEVQVRQDLHRFKQMLETGETSTIEGQTAAREHTALYLNP